MCIFPWVKFSEFMRMASDPLELELQVAEHFFIYVLRIKLCLLGRAISIQDSWAISLNTYWHVKWLRLTWKLWSSLETLSRTSKDSQKHQQATMGAFGFHSPVRTGCPLHTKPAHTPAHTGYPMHTKPALSPVHIGCPLHTKPAHSRVHPLIVLWIHLVYPSRVCYSFKCTGFNVFIMPQDRGYLLHYINAY